MAIADWFTIGSEPRKQTRAKGKRSGIDQLKTLVYTELSEMSAGGFEPPTYRTGICCSIP